MKPHVFVAMPFGIKPGMDGTPIDFNRVYKEYVRPALEAAGLQVLRADQEQRAGDIRTDMFQELLMADLVVADLTIDNPNVWYELGVRHALRARGVVLICGGRTSTAFDLYTDRKLRYELKEGAPDPDMVAADRTKLRDMVVATMKAWQGRKISPVYNLLPNLQEPNWRNLRIGDVREFWDLHEAWEERIEIARAADHIGDILVLAGEAPVAAFRAMAWCMAGRALRRAERFEFALELLERGLEVEPDNIDAQREKGICLQRLALAGARGHSAARAREHYRNILETTPGDTETWALLGRVDKDAWVQAWRRTGASAQGMREDAAYEDALLRAAIESYAKAYRNDNRHHFSGINALVLMCLYRHLTGDARFDDAISIMSGAVRFAASCASEAEGRFWAGSTLATLTLLDGVPAAVTAAFKDAIASVDVDWFALNSVRNQIAVINDLAFRPEACAAALQVLDRAMSRLGERRRWQPRKVVLFSGHMMDKPGRATPRFPAEMEPRAADEIRHAIAALDLGPGDLALSQGAAGGDILFIEACRARGVRLQVMLPYAEPDFIQRSVLPSLNGESWRQRYLAVMSDGVELRIMPEELGPIPAEANAYERCNLWLLSTALAMGAEKLEFICLWNGAEGNGPGGTAHMYDEVRRRTGRINWIDTRKL